MNQESKAVTKESELDNIISNMREQSHRLFDNTNGIEERLNTLHRKEENLELNDEEKMKEPETIVEKLRALLSNFDRVNNRLADCNRRLNDIVG